MKNENLLEDCNLCHRKCGVNRLKDEIGYCKSTDKIKLARAELHHWEEPCISGIKGSGTVFFSNCNLSCVFCQNYEVSQQGKGIEITIERLSHIFIELQQKGAHNINLVTPTHFVPQIIEAIDISRQNGLTLPIVYNTNGFDSLETIKALKGYIDVYLPDFKYFDDQYSIKYSNGSHYVENIKVILDEMVSQVGAPIFKDDIIQKGVIVRHLLLPKLLFDSKKIVDYLYSTYEDKIYISLMNQYTPMYKASLYPEINKPINSKIYDSLVDYAASLGVENGFIQGEGTSTKNFIPDFNFNGVE